MRAFHISSLPIFAAVSIRMSPHPFRGRRGKSRCDDAADGEPKHDRGWHLEPIEETDDISNKIGHGIRFGRDLRQTMTALVVADGPQRRRQMGQKGVEYAIVGAE